MIIFKIKQSNDFTQGHKRYRLTWLTNIALAYKPKCAEGGGGVAGSQPMSTAVWIYPLKFYGNLSTSKNVYFLNDPITAEPERSEILYLS